MGATGDYNKNVCNCSCLSAGLVKVMCAIYQDILNKKDSNEIEPAYLYDDHIPIFLLP